MEIGIVDLIKGTEEKDIKYLKDFLDLQWDHNAHDFYKNLNPHSFVTLFDNEKCDPYGSILFSREEIHKEINRLGKQKHWVTWLNRPKKLSKIADIMPDRIKGYIDYVKGHMPDMIGRGINSVDANETTEKIKNRWKKDKIKTYISALPGIALLGGSYICAEYGDPETTYELFLTGGTYLVADMGICIDYFAGKEGMYRYILTNRKADEISSQIGNCKVECL